MSKSLFTATMLLAGIVFLHSYAKTDNGTTATGNPNPTEMLRQLPDSVFTDVKMEDLLRDEVYMKLAADGWSPQEIVAIMNTAVKDKASAKKKDGYVAYAKQWLPAYGRAAGGDSLYQFIDTTYDEKAIKAIARVVPDDILNKTWPKVVYNADDRKRGIRNPGYFRTVEHKPSSGRMHWAALHPENPDSLYAIPERAGIFVTGDCGKTWRNITDNIPVRADRGAVVGYSIPVDPDDFNHVFGFMAGGSVYETFDGGDTWRKVEGGKSLSFKRGHCFRDAEGNLKFIGCTSGGWNSSVFISEDTCRTWTKVVIPDSIKDTNPSNGAKGAWFQEVAFDLNDRNKIYLPTSRSIYYFDDGAKSTIVNGVRTYNIKKMHFTVYDRDSTVVRHPDDEPENTGIFPQAGTQPGYLCVSPQNPDCMWFMCSRPANYQGLYRTSDGGKTWITLADGPARGAAIFGHFNDPPNGWLGGFGVNYADPNYMYGVSMCGGFTTDGGKTFSHQHWGARLRSEIDGQWYYVTNARHSCDNHFVLSHKSGRQFRGSDAGMLMLDKNLTNNAWVNIGSNMGNMMYYYVSVNEFGDQAMIGNTQDIDVQTWRYGRWGHWRGYEGSEASFNPYTNIGLFSGGGGSGGFDESLPFESWFARYNLADVVTGSWYMVKSYPQNSMRTLFRIDDIGRSAVQLCPGTNGTEGYPLAQALSHINNFALCRDKGRTTMYCVNLSHQIFHSIDNGNTFEPVLFNGIPAKFTNARIASDPDNSDILYIGLKGKVVRLYVKESRFEEVGKGLPAINCGQLIFHEGSGDLYFINGDNASIYILENGSDTWRYWVKGYNPGKIGDCHVSINYTTQEMVFSDYGRGVWVADLEHPSDRYFKDGFTLKELSNKDGRRTIGINTNWTIPLYYYYEWTVNGEKLDNPYQYLTRRLNVGDKVQLKLILRESPDVSSTSAEYTVTETEAQSIVRSGGNAIYSNGDGRLDIGYTDYFFNDFTIDMWVKPASDGVLLCNRQHVYSSDAKGFVLFLEGRHLKFRYSPRNKFSQPTYETAITQEWTIDGGEVPYEQWSHIAVTHKRDGNICLYVNGNLTGSAPRYIPEATLNNSVPLSLFGDAIERGTMEASVDELKIWNRELPIEEIRREMYSVNTEDNDGLVAYYDFNGDNLAGDVETFSRRTPLSRVRAVVSHSKMLVPVSAHAASYETMETGDKVFGSRKGNILRLRMKSAPGAVGVYAYNTENWLSDDDNLDYKYYDVAPTGYCIHPFERTALSDSVTVEFYPMDEPFNMEKRYRLYTCDPNASKPRWILVDELKGDASTGTLSLTVAELASITDRKLMVVSLKPAIELSIEGVDESGEFEIFDDTKASYHVTARLLENMKEPENGYQMTSDSALIQAPDLLYFTRGVAETDLTVDVSKLGKLNERKTTRLRGSDERMIPMPIDVINRIAPREIGNSVELINGGITIGNGTDFSRLNNSNQMSLMGWVRIDNASVLTGTKPLIFFRSASPSVASGIHLEGGNLRCHWNDESWSWSQRTNLNVTAQDLGKWIHVAIVARPDGMDYYLNGMRAWVTRKMNKGRVYSGLLLGQNRDGDRWFSGAFDQVLAFDRSLTPDEVVKYMHRRVLLNDSSLVACITMDDYNSEGKLQETAGYMNMKNYGSVTDKHPSIIPFDSRDVCLSTAEESPISIDFPIGRTRGVYVTTFNGTPYNFFNSRTSELVPLNHEFYTLTYSVSGTVAATDTLTVHYRHPSIVAGDSLTMGIRELGTSAPIATFVSGVAASDGEADFVTPYSQMAKASEVMFYMSPSATRRPVSVTTEFGNGVKNGERLMIEDGFSRIPVTVRVLSGSADDNVSLTVKESGYASIENPQIDMTVPESTHYINIDMERINRMTLNPLTVNVVGAKVEELSLELYLEPRVELRLKNGEDPNTYVATEIISTLDVDAVLVDGYLDKEVELSTDTDMKSTLDIAGGNLLLNKSVNIDNLEYYPSNFGEIAEGWNLIGNPYLTDINLTKHQNVSYDPESLTKYIYHCNPVTMNYEVYDMTAYDARQRIHPFQSYFVQTMTEDAEFTVTPVAKEKAASKKTLDCYTVQEDVAVQLGVYAKGEEADKTELRIDRASSELYQVNEDAAKLWSLNGRSAQIYTYDEADNAMSIDCRPYASTLYVPVGLKLPVAGEYELRADKLQGFDNNYQIYLTDNLTGTRIDLKQDTAPYAFSVDNDGDCLGRFELVFEDAGPLVGVDNVSAKPHYQVYTGDGTCTVTGLMGDATITIYDIAGRQIVRSYTPDEEFETSLEAGPYVVTINENGKNYNVKIIVK